MENITLQMAQRGVITIPKSLRNSYGMQPGDTFTLLDLGGVFILSPQKSEIDALANRVAARESRFLLPCIPHRSSSTKATISALPPVLTGGNERGGSSFRRACPERS